MTGSGVSLNTQQDRIGLGLNSIQICMLKKWLAVLQIRGALAKFRYQNCIDNNRLLADS
jgi:hypothetical protein